MAEIASPEFPGERLMICPDPRLREERARRREELLSKTEEILREISAAAAHGKPGPRNRDRALKALGRGANRGKVEKHFRIEVRDDGVTRSRNRGRIAAEARLDGIYVVRASLGAGDIGADRAVEACKALSSVERAFRTMKTSHLEVRPVFVYGEERVRAHVF
ncbi:MAG: IS1634 family transposase, partial [Albidovulum sp.]|nr:IS1634 family transposase [Albidovulum sp.]